MIDYSIKREPPLPPPFTDPDLIKLICSMAIPAKVDVTVKFSELPKVRFGAISVAFAVEAEGQTILIEVGKKAWRKLEAAVAEWPEWVCTIQGKMGSPIEGGFQLRDPGLQVFEKKPKPPKAEPATTPAPETPVAIAVESAPEVAPAKDAAIYSKLSLKSKKPGA